MLKVPWAVGLVAALCTGSVACAEIIEWSCQDDGDGALVMQSVTLTPDTPAVGEYTLQMFADQFWAPGHMNGDFVTDTPTDPTVWVIETIENNTNFIWTGYHIDFGMDQPFSIIGVVAPLDWTWAITPPAPGLPLPGHPSPGLGWVGEVDYFAGTPIAPGQSGNFGLVVQFEGSVSFCTEQYPVPEPVSLGLLGLAGLLFARRR